MRWWKSSARTGGSQHSRREADEIESKEGLCKNMQENDRPELSRFFDGWLAETRQIESENRKRWQPGGRREGRGSHAESRRAHDAVCVPPIAQVIVDPLVASLRVSLFIDPEGRKKEKNKSMSKSKKKDVHANLCKRRRTRTGESGSVLQRIGRARKYETETPAGVSQCGNRRPRYRRWRDTHPPPPPTKEGAWEEERKQEGEGAARSPSLPWRAQWLSYRGTLCISERGRYST